MAYSRETFFHVREVMRQSRAKAQEMAQKRREQLHRDYPALLACDLKLQETARDLVFVACGKKDGVAKNMQTLQQKNQELQEERKKLLRLNGLPLDYTEPQYACSICNDTGSLQTGETCQCFHIAMMLEEIVQSGIGRLADSQRFDNFNPDIYENAEEMRQTLSNAQEYAENFSKGRSNLLFMGYTGLGKTHLTTAIAVKIIKKGFGVVYDSAQNIFDVLAKATFQKEQADNREKERYLQCDLLIIDDLGTEMTTQWTLSALYHLLNTRVNQGRSIIINTNLSPTELRRRYDDRITSRLLGEFKVCLFLGKDRRSLPQEARGQL